MSAGYQPEQIDECDDLLMATWQLSHRPAGSIEPATSITVAAESSAEAIAAARAQIPEGDLLQFVLLVGGVTQGN